MIVQAGQTGETKIVTDGRGGNALSMSGGYGGAASNLIPSYTSGTLRIDAGFRTPGSLNVASTYAIFGQATDAPAISRMGLQLSGTGLLQCRIGTGSADYEPVFSGFIHRPNTDYFVRADWAPSTGTVSWYVSLNKGLTWRLAQTMPAAIPPGTTVQSGGAVMAGNRASPAGLCPYSGLIYFGRIYFGNSLVSEFNPSRDSS